MRPLLPQHLASARRGGRKLVITPGGRNHRPRPLVDSSLVKALARAHRWQRLLETGECASITELAAAEKIDRSYLCRVLRLTLLAPELVEAILDGRQPEKMTVSALMKWLPVGRGAEHRGSEAADMSIISRAVAPSPLA